MNVISKWLNERVKRQGRRRSSQWPIVRQRHLLKNPKCVVCDGTKYLEVHHIVPFHIAPNLELEPDNLITLCEGRKNFNCHLIAGHKLNFRKINNTCRADAMFMRHLFH